MGERSDRWKEGQTGLKNQRWGKLYISVLTGIRFWRVQKMGDIKALKKLMANT